MFHLVATEWRDTRPGGRVAGPGSDPHTSTSSEVLRGPFRRPRNALVRDGCARGWRDETDLTPRCPPGRFLQVAPRNGREA